MTAAAAPPASELERLRASFERLARVVCDARSPLYARICRAVARDDATLELVMRAPVAQRRPSLLLAAIHDLLLAGAEHELAAHVPTVAAGAVATGDPGALALGFCRAHEDAIARILETRSTQTNEVNRSAALLPALAHATPPGESLRLVELGASAGLNLLLDRYAYRYHHAGGGVSSFERIGPETRHTPTVICDVEGELPDLRSPPAIAQRIGVDLHPVDVRDPAAARWLLACTWPDEHDRVARLRAAIALARRDPPAVVRGDALALLPRLVGDGADVHPVVWHSWVLAYWTPTDQRALARAIDALGARRDLTWIYLEQPCETPGLPTPGLADLDDSALVAVRYRDGARTIERLADAHPHVHTMRWLSG